MKMIRFAFFLSLCYLYVLFTPVFSQNTLEKFGKNRIQYKKFDWQFISTQNFEIYYYDYGTRLSQFAARFLEEDFNQMTDVLGFQPTRRSRIFLYNSIADLQQSNAGISDDGIVVGGLTDFFKAQVEIPYTGSELAFKKELRKGVALMLVREMMFGTNIKEMIQTSYLGKFNEWFLFGMAAYMAEGWSEELDDYVRDMVRKNTRFRPHLVTGKDAVLMGQSIWNFVAQKYGKNNISSILNASRITRNERIGIGYALGMSYGNFIDEWEDFYKTPNKLLLENLKKPENAQRLAGKNRKRKTYNQLKISPDGTKIAYSENKNGRYKIYVQNLSNLKRKLIFKGGYDVINQKFDEDIPVISWKDNINLGIIYLKKNTLQLNILNVDNRKKSYQKEWSYFNHINSFNFSDDGNYIVFSADRKGEVQLKTTQNDIFWFNIKENNLKQITDDFFDDNEPSFLPNSNSEIIFSSNRIKDSMQTITRIDYGNYTQDFNNFNIFIYSNNSPKTLKRITNTVGINTKPRFIDKNTLLYISDESGIFQLKKQDLNTQKITTLTNYSQSIREFDFHKEEQNKFVYLMIDRSRIAPYYIPNFTIDNEETTNSLTERVNIRNKNNRQTQLTSFQPKTKIDSTKQTNKTDKTEIFLSDEIDTDNYT
jgi:Tol biopolymer transport system component